jgi:predicted  nucleic acid-binding Zn-ribbon protein
MNFLKKVGNTVADAAKKTKYGIELESLKSRRHAVDEEIADLKKSFSKLAEFASERAELATLLQYYNDQKTEWKVKVAQLPEANATETASRSQVLTSVYTQLLTNIEPLIAAVIASQEEIKVATGDLDEAKYNEKLAKLESERKSIEERLVEVRAIVHN